jgi:hypothetical protein
VESRARCCTNFWKTGCGDLSETGGLVDALKGFPAAVGTVFAQTGADPALPSAAAFAGVRKRARPQAPAALGLNWGVQTKRC